MADSPELFKVVLVFNLQDGQADEELRRSSQPKSFPSRLREQPGFAGMELVKVSDSQTLSIQTWRTAADWWTALEAVKSGADDDDRPSILVSRDFYAGHVAADLAPPV